MAFEIENVIRLYVPNGGAHLEICKNPDDPSFGMLLHTPDETSKQCFW